MLAYNEKRDIKGRSCWTTTLGNAPWGREVVSATAMLLVLLYLIEFEDVLVESSRLWRAGIAQYCSYTSLAA